MEIENEIDINETDDVNINALTPKQKALRLNALVKLAQGDVFTTHDFEEALSLTRQLMKRQGVKCVECGNDLVVVITDAPEICWTCAIER